MKNIIIGFMFIACALFGFNNYGYAQTYQNGYVVYENYAVPTPAPASTTTYNRVMSNPTPITYGTPVYSSPVVRYSVPTPVFNTPVVNQPVRRFGNAVRNNVPRYTTVQETRYRKVCNGRGGCQLVPYTVNVRKLVR